jgi:hypothetical protein
MGSGIGGLQLHRRFEQLLRLVRLIHLRERLGQSQLCIRVARAAGQRLSCIRRRTAWTLGKIDPSPTRQL